MRLIDADSLIESLLDCPDDEEVGLKNAKEAGIKGNDDTVIIDFWRRCKQSFVNFVNSEPTVALEKRRHRVAHKHGHWIADRIGDKHGLCYDCSKCGNMGTVKSNYCPWCGAKMNDEVAE